MEIIFQNLFSKILTTNSIINQIKKKAFARFNSISGKFTHPEIFSYSPSQNPFFEKVKPSKEMESYNPFFPSNKTNKIRLDNENLILHKNISLIPKHEKPKISFSKSSPHINFKGIIGKDTKPLMFLNPRNFKDLKKELVSGIYKQFYNQYYKKKK